MSNIFYKWAAAPLLILCLVISQSIALSAQNNDKLPIYRSKALALVNQSRKEKGLPPLIFGKALNIAAQSHSSDMLRRNYYSHNSPEGDSVGDRFVKSGGSKWLLTAENIAFCKDCDPPVSDYYLEELHRGWMNSPGHRANILREGLTEFGFGISIGQNGNLYAVQNFSGPGTSSSKSANGRQRALPPEQQGESATEKINIGRKNASIPALEYSARLSEVARQILAESGIEDFALNDGNNLFDRLSPKERRKWRSLNILAGACGGCGTEPTEADIEFFTSQWLGSEKYRGMLLDKKSQALGFAIAANGHGKKVAIALLGRKY